MISERGRCEIITFTANIYNDFISREHFSEYIARARAHTGAVRCEISMIFESKFSAGWAFSRAAGRIARARSPETITRALAFNEGSFSAARLPAIHTVPQLDEHVRYMYAGTSKYRSAPHKLSKLRV